MQLWYLWKTVPNKIHILGICVYTAWAVNLYVHTLKQYFWKCLLSAKTQLQSPWHCFKVLLQANALIY